MVSIRCKECDKKYKFKETALGKTFDCKCGHQFLIEDVEKEIEEETEEERPRRRKENSRGKKRKQPRKERPQEPSDQAAEEDVAPKKKAKGPVKEIDLTNTKICSKCKAIVELSAVTCPKCHFNLLGLNYDEQHRKELTRDSTKIIYKYGKYIAPLGLFLIVYFYAYLQKSKIDDLKEFEKVLFAQKDKRIDLDRREKLAGSKKKDFLFHRGWNNDMRHFIAVAKDGSDEISVMGSGFFSFRTPGVSLKMGHSSKRRDVIEYYIKDPETGKPKQIFKKEYEFIQYSALAYHFFY